jgi:hypothetical protein
MNRFRKAAVVALALLAAPAFAHEEDGRGTVWSWLGDWDPTFYAGASVQQTSFSDWDVISRIDSASFTSREFDEEDSGLRVMGGMTFTQYLALEASYADFGGASFAGISDGSGATWEPGPQREELELEGFGLHVTGRYPLAKAFFAVARAGAWALRSETRVTGTFDDAGTPTPYDMRDTSNSTQFAYGAALEYDGFAPFRLGLEYDASNLDEHFLSGEDGQRHSIGLTLKYVFTGESQ